MVEVGKRCDWSHSSPLHRRRRDDAGSARPERPPKSKEPPTRSARSARPRSPAPSAPRSSGTTSSSTTPPPRWSSRRCSSRSPRRTPAAGVVRDVRRRLRRATGRRVHLRPLGRPDRPQGDPDRHAADDGYRDHAGRRPAREPTRSARRRRCCSCCCGWCRASPSAVSGAARCCSRWSGATRSDAASWPAWPQLGVAFGLILGTGFLYLVSRPLSDDAVPVVGLADPVPVQHRAGRRSVSTSGCRSWRRRCSPSGSRRRTIARLPVARGDQGPLEADPARAPSRGCRSRRRSTSSPRSR